MRDSTAREVWWRRSQPAERREEGSVLPAAGGDVRSSGQRSIFHGKCNARKGGRQGDNRTAGGSRQSHGGRITGIASGITYSIAENVRRPKEFRKHSPDL